MKKKILLLVLIIVSFLLIVISIFNKWLSGKITIPILISGENGPTSIFIAGKMGQNEFLYLITIVVVIITVTVFWMTVIKKKK